MPTLLLFAALGLERLAELVIHRRHVAALHARGAVFLERDGFGLIVVAQGVLFAGTFAEAWWAPWTGFGPWTWPLLGLALLAQALRYWVIRTLGDRWAIRVATLPGAPRIVTGPYRFVRHPNYVAVLAEAIVIPAAFAAWGTLLVVVPLTSFALWRRIVAEDRALADAEPTPA